MTKTKRHVFAAIFVFALCLCLIQITSAKTTKAENTIDSISSANEERCKVTYVTNGVTEPEALGVLGFEKLDANNTIKYGGNFAISFFVKDGYDVSTLKVEATYNDKVRENIALERNDNGSYYCAIYAITTDLEFYINADIITYNITYHYDGYTYNETYTSDKSKTLFQPNKTGYNFQGWYKNSSYTGEKINVLAKGSYGNLVLYGYMDPIEYSVILNANGGTFSNGKSEITAKVKYDSSYTLTVPTRSGYRFAGWYSSISGGTQYANSNGTSGKKWSETTNLTLYAHWDKMYTITFDLNNGSGEKITKTVYAGDSYPSITIPSYRGGVFLGFYGGTTSYSTKYYDANGRAVNSSYNKTDNLTLYAVWNEYTYTVCLVTKHSEEKDVHRTLLNNYGISYSSEYTFTAADSLTYEDSEKLFSYWEIILGGYVDFDADTNPWLPYTEEKELVYSPKEIIERFYSNLKPGAFITIRAVYAKEPPRTCVAEDSLITLSDGSQKAVNELTGDEELLVWNMFTGSFDKAPILFVDKEDTQKYAVINLKFSDGNVVKVIGEHAFWDYDLNRYVYLDEGASQYIGHWFNKMTADASGNAVSDKVQLVEVNIKEEQTTAWSPVTYGHLCYYVNGMLSMPGGIDGLFNIFEVDSTTMKYDEAAMEEDIAQYGLFTYEELAKQVSGLTEDMFEAVNGQYLKVSIGKGLITIEEIQALIDRYATFFA